MTGLWMQILGSGRVRVLACDCKCECSLVCAVKWVSVGVSECGFVCVYVCVCERDCVCVCMGVILCMWVWVWVLVCPPMGGCIGPWTCVNARRVLMRVFSYRMFVHDKYLHVTVMFLCMYMFLVKIGCVSVCFCVRVCVYMYLTII